MRSSLFFSLLVSLPVALACGSDPVVDAGLDTGVRDAGPDVADTGAPDTGAPDTGVPDTGEPDTGPPPFGLEELVYNTACVVETVNPDETRDVAATLSETGCYADLETRTPIAALIPFDLNSPLWTDGALKRRYMALPPDTTVGYEPEIAWDFPPGTILMKEFILQPDERDSTSERILETRFLVKYSPLFWRGYSYRWNDELTDATLMENSVDDVILEYPVTTADGSTRMHSHVYPGRVACLECHAPRAGGANGPQTAQMNRDFDFGPFGGNVDNQLRALEHIGFFTEPLPAPPEELPALVDPEDETASLEARARSYLHANCAHCHRSNGSATSSTLWINHELDLAASNACIGRAAGGAISAECESFNERIVPGSAAMSLIQCVMTSGEMPPVGTYRPDPARQVVFDWIDSLETCP